jgi:hypothetical protein
LHRFNKSKGATAGGEILLKEPAERGKPIIDYEANSLDIPINKSRLVSHNDVFAEYIVSRVA